MKEVIIMKKNNALNRRINRNTKAPMIAVIMSSILLIAAMFMPYLTAMEEFKELLELADQMHVISLLDFFNMVLDSASGTFTVLGILAGLAIFATVFAILRKPVGSLVFGILETAATVLLHMTFVYDKMMNYYNFGIGNRLMFVACAGLLISTIWMIVCKSKTKKNFLRAKNAQ